MAVSTTVLSSLLLLVCFCCDAFLPSLASSEENFLGCLSEKIPGELLYTQSSSGFMSVLTASVQNARFATNATVRPACIVTASDVAHVQDAVRCGRRHGVRLRVRSGGHDYEGLSYRSVRAEVFAVLDLARLRAVRVRPGEASAWVDSGATLGELYYAVGMASPTLAFPGGACPTVGVGGVLSGGGIGLMMRKVGNGADNVLDARVVNADRGLPPMGEDLFWAIRGGGGESFGVVVSWKLKLSVVPRTVTVAKTDRAFDESTAAVLAKWETFALRPFIPDLTIRAVAQGNRTVFQTLFLGSCSRLPLVSSNPREAFVNYRDLDIGQNAVGDDGVTTYESGRVWGEKYFMGNFHRLATVKGKVDPGDYFRNEQSIPPFLPV
uniref:Reticuline oxidase-like protein n=1 Tax=Aegilops tauschii TaxID=37682 RepID=M8B1A0_AEGTA